MTDQTPDPWKGVKQRLDEAFDATRSFTLAPVRHAIEAALAAERAQHQQEVEDWIRIAARDAGDATARINAQASQIEELRTAISTAEATIEQRDETIRQLQDAFARCQEVQQATAETWRIEHDQMAEQIRLLRGAMAADDERLRRAAEQAGILYVSCDTAEALAEQIARLSAEVEEQRSFEILMIKDATRLEAARDEAVSEAATLRAERDAAQQQIAILRQIVIDTLWMAGRYVDGRMSYAVGMYNDARLRAEQLGCAAETWPAVDGMDPERPMLREQIATLTAERDRLKAGRRSRRGPRGTRARLERMEAALTWIAESSGDPVVEDAARAALQSTRPQEQP